MFTSTLTKRISFRETEIDCERAWFAWFIAQTNPIGTTDKARSGSNCFEVMCLYQFMMAACLDKWQGKRIVTE